VKAAEGKLARLDKTAAARDKEVRILTDAVATVEAELRRHAAEHAKEWWKELERDNRGADERLSAALVAVHAALDDYVLAGGRAGELLRLVAPERARVERVPEPDHEISRFAKNAPGYARAISVPLPGQPGTAATVRVEPAPPDAPVTFEVVGR
jgi:hypothetical protein